MTWDRKRENQLRGQFGDHKKFGIAHPSGVTGVLVRLFRVIIHDLGINGMRWSRLMEDYLPVELADVERKRRQKKNYVEPPADQIVEMNRRDRTSVRGNLNKEFNRNIMTWKVFCKAMRFLQFRSFKIVIVAVHKNGAITEHSQIISFEDVTRELEAPDDPAEGGDHEMPLPGTEDQKDI